MMLARLATLSLILFAQAAQGLASPAASLVSTPVAAQSAEATLQAIAQRQSAPESTGGRFPLSQARARHAMVVTAHPLATAAALDILRAGGSAADAAVTAQAVLGLVEPQSSGFAGGAFLVHARRGEVTAIDGRETAPATATPERFLNADGTPMSLDAALARARAVGVPGVPALLAEAHRRWGRLPWARLLAPAIRLAEEGVPVSRRLAILARQDALLALDPGARAHFYGDDGTPWPAGHRLRNPAYAALLRTLARKGPQAFYQGPLAEDLVRQLRAAGSDITAADWAGYRARVTPALCLTLAATRLCSAPPPAGGLTVLEDLGLWQAAEDAATPESRRDDLASLHRLIEAERLGFADRQRYSGDPAFVAVPVAGLLAPDYLRERAALIGERAAPGPVAAGQPAGAPLAATDTQWLEHGTSHFSIVDRRGDWLAMTSSIEDVFGSRLMLSGLMFNNQLTDFSFLPAQDGRPLANRVGAGKRPRSAMSPLLALDAQGRVLLATGSPGGSRIIGFNAGTVMAWLRGERDPGRLVSRHHAMNHNGPTALETGTDAAVRDALRARGHDIREVEMTSGQGLILRTPDGLAGAADPRREGRADGW